MRKIKLTKGKYALVDDEDFEYLNQWKWHVRKQNGGKYYVGRTINFSNKKTQTIRMHRVIINPPVGYCVDHKNGNGLDNQRENIRLATRTENARNKKSAKNSSSKYLGVTTRSNRKTFRARIRVDEKEKYLGDFKTQEAAAIAYNNAATKYYGEFANINIIQQ